MQISTVILVLAAAATSSLANASLGSVPVPWDGRAYNLTMETLDSKYVTSQLGAGGDRNIADYLSIQRQYRPEKYNNDDGALAIGVDGNSVFDDDTAARRSQLWQIIEAADETTFFRASLKKEDAFLNPYQWDLVSLEGVFSIGVDASVEPPLIFLDANGKAWSTTFAPGTWYNFGVGIEKDTADGSLMSLEFYTSTGQDDLVFDSYVGLQGPITVNDYRIGLVTKTSNGSAPVMNAQQDVVMFNGISAEATAFNAGAPAPAQSISARD